MIGRMFSDTLWIYTAIAGSIFGVIFITYMKTTRIGLWFYAKGDLTMDFLVERWGLTWLEQPENAWRKKYPKITKKIDDLELRIHYLEDKDNKKHEFE